MAVVVAKALSPFAKEPLLGVMNDRRGAEAVLFPVETPISGIVRDLFPPSIEKLLSIPISYRSIVTAATTTTVTIRQSLFHLCRRTRTPGRSGIPMNALDANKGLRWKDDTFAFLL